MAYEEVGLRLSTQGVAETSTGLALAGAGLDNLGQKAAAAAPQLARVGITAGQTRQAFQQLPMQLQDVAVSLAGGMPLWMVLAQQGPQITSSFGGVRETMVALRNVIGPTSLALGGLAAVAAIGTAAFLAGRQEALEYERQILLTGNAAGETAGQLDAMARRSDAVAGTQAQAAAVLAQLVSTGRVSNAQLEIGTQAAIALQRSLGVQSERTVAALAKLGQDPVRAAAELNQQTNFLTESVWRQIRTLQEQGRVQEAGAVAQEAYAKVAIQRASEMETRLGWLERGWRAVGDAAREAWDFTKGIGRPETIQQQLAAVELQIKQAERLSRLPAFSSSPLADVQKFRQDQANLQEMLRLQMRAADTQASSAADVRDRVAGDVSRIGKPGPEFSAIRDARMQYQQDFLRSEKAFYNDLARLQEEEQRREKAIDDENTERQRDYLAERQRAAQLAERQLQVLERERDGILEETAAIGLNARALMERRQAEVDSNIARLESMLAVRDAIEVNDEETESLRRQVAVLREKRAAIGTRFDAQERQRELDENERRMRSVEESIVDGLVNGFREGRRPADIFLNEFKAQAARTILQFPMQLLGERGAGGYGSGSFLGSLLTLLNLSGGGYSTSPADIGPPVDLAGPSSASVISERAGRMSAGSSRAGEGGAASTGSGRTYNFAPVYNIDARSDKEQVMALVQQANNAALAEFVDRMDRREA
jgi:phage-related minor tail protein